MEALGQGVLTVPCQVRLELSDGRGLDAVIHLPTDPGRTRGISSVESLLEGHREFIPVGLEGGSSLLARDAICAVEMAADAPGAPDLLEAGGSFDVVTLHLDSGKTVSGVLSNIAPLESMRMSDIFNIPGRFLTLGAGDRLFLIAKSHLVMASF